MKIGQDLPPPQEPPKHTSPMAAFLDKIARLETHVKGGVLAAVLGLISPGMVITKPIKEDGPLLVLEQKSGKFCDVHLPLETFLQIVKCFGVWDQSRVGKQVVLKRRGVV